MPLADPYLAGVPVKYSFRARGGEDWVYTIKRRPAIWNQFSVYPVAYIVGAYDAGNYDGFNAGTWER